MTSSGANDYFQKKWGESELTVPSLIRGQAMTEITGGPVYLKVSKHGKLIQFLCKIRCFSTLVNEMLV